MDFCYQDERFADLQLLRYRLNGFEKLSLRQKVLVYYLSEATLWGRDITFDQFGKYNLRIRKMLEVVYCDLTIPHDTDEFKAFAKQQLELSAFGLWSRSSINNNTDVKDSYLNGTSAIFINNLGTTGNVASAAEKG